MDRAEMAPRNVLFAHSRETRSHIDIHEACLGKFNDQASFDCLLSIIPS